MVRLRVILSGVLALCGSSSLALANELPSPSGQDIQILGRILSFREASSSGAMTIAIVYNGADPQSLAEAQALSGLMGAGVTVGKLVLRPVLIEQSRLSGATGYAAIFSAAAVNSGLLQTALRQQQVPCITRHVEQVSKGACIISIRSSPTVSIAYNNANAAAAGVRFATAFIMMVREI